MAEVIFELDVARNLSIFNVTGHVVAADLLGIISDYYGQYPTPDKLWIFESVIANDVTSTGLNQVAEFAEQFTADREVPRTAFVADHEMAAVLIKLYGAIAQAMKVSIEHKIFSTKQDALVWLDAG